MRMSPRWLLPVGGIGFAMLWGIQPPGAGAVHADDANRRDHVECSRSCVYFNLGSYGVHTRCQQSGSGTNCSESRWDCRDPGLCNPCGFCHGTTEKYASLAPEVHKTELPKFESRLAAGSKIPWGDGGALVAEKDGTLTEVDKAGKPVWRFPAGSVILRAKTGTPELILLSGEPLPLK